MATARTTTTSSSAARPKPTASSPVAAATASSASLPRSSSAPPTATAPTAAPQAAPAGSSGGLKPILRRTSTQEYMKLQEPREHHVHFAAPVREHSRDRLTPIAQASDVINELVKGAPFIKLRGKKFYERFFFYEPETASISWYSKKSGPSIKNIATKDLVSVTAGKGSKGFAKAEDTEYQDWQCFTVVHKGGVLDLVANSRDERDLWVTGLHHLMSRGDAAAAQVKTRRDWVNATFTRADTKKEGKLTQQEAVVALEELLPFVRRETIARRVENLLEMLADTTNTSVRRMSSPAALALLDKPSPPVSPTVGNNLNGSTTDGSEYLITDIPTEPGDMRIDFERFFALFKSMGTRRELYFIMHKYTDKTETLSSKGIHAFLEIEQMMLHIKTHDIEHMIERYEPIPELKKRKHMGIDGFARMMREELTLHTGAGPSSVIMAAGSAGGSNHHSKPDKLKDPLTYYFISASHNSYLEEGQVQGGCSVEAVSRALGVGVRWIELDIWDVEGQMMVWHGHTKTTPVDVKSCLETIKLKAFEKSPYPLFVLIELHVRDAQQQALIDMLKNVLGPLLYTTTPDERQKKKRLPSPEELRGKILLVSSRASEKAIRDNKPEEVEEIDEFSFYAQVKKKKGRASKPDVGAADASATPFVLLPQWSPLIALEHVAFSSLLQAKRLASPWRVFSISEKSLEDALAADAADFVKFTCDNLVRAYPAGTRVDSDNPDPDFAWSMGCQIVALNYQTNDVPTQIAKCKFAGHDGYLARPAFLNDKHSSYDPDPKNWSKLLAENQQAALRQLSAGRSLTLTIISAQQLVQSAAAMQARKSQFHDVIDPYVHVEIFGAATDVDSYTTRALDNNSFDPYWNETCKFNIQHPGLAVFHILVLDDDILHDNFLGQALIPFSSISAGYRHVQLYDRQGDPIPHSTAFLKIVLEEFDMEAMQRRQEDPESSTAGPQRGGRKRSRRSSLRLMVKATGKELQPTNVPVVDEIFEKCNDVIGEISRLKAEVDRAHTEFLQQAGSKDTSTVAEAMRSLSVNLQGVAFTVEANGAGVAIKLLDDAKLAAPAQNALKALTDLSAAFTKTSNMSTEILTHLEDMNMRLNKLEEDLPDITRDAKIDENHSVKFLRDVKKGIESFRTLPSDLRATTAALDEEMLMLKHVLLDIRRSSMI